MYVLFVDMDLAQIGVLRRFCLCMVALLLQLLLLTELLLWLGVDEDDSVGQVVVVEVPLSTSLSLDTALQDSLSLSNPSVDGGGPVGPLCVCGAKHTPFVRLSMLT